MGHANPSSFAQYRRQADRIALPTPPPPES
jgi:hypothetical protein